MVRHQTLSVSFLPLAGLRLASPTEEATVGHPQVSEASANWKGGKLGEILLVHALGWLVACRLAEQWTPSSGHWTLGTGRWAFRYVAVPSAPSVPSAEAGSRRAGACVRVSATAIVCG